MNTINSFFSDLPVFLKSMVITLIIILFYLRIKELISLIKYKRHKREYIEKLKCGNLSKKDLHDYTPFEFKYWCTEFLEKKGFTHIDVTPSMQDGGKDIICRKGTETYFVECKRFEFKNNPEFKVDMEIVRKLVGAMEACSVHKGIIITTGFASNKAVEYARTLPGNYKVDIIEGDELVNQYDEIRLKYTEQKTI
ncbi:MAG: restriction endonuclease [Clostridiaceae bacterium]